MYFPSFFFKNIRKVLEGVFCQEKTARGLLSMKYRLEVFYQNYTNICILSIDDCSFIEGCLSERVFCREQTHIQPSVHRIPIGDFLSMEEGLKAFYPQNSDNIYFVNRQRQDVFRPQDNNRVPSFKRTATRSLLSIEQRQEVFRQQNNDRRSSATKDLLSIDLLSIEQQQEVFSPLENRLEIHLYRNRFEILYVH